MSMCAKSLLRLHHREIHLKAVKSRGGRPRYEIAVDWTIQWWGLGGTDKFKIYWRSVCGWLIYGESVTFLQVFQSAFCYWFLDIGDTDKSKRCHNNGNDFVPQRTFGNILEPFFCMYAHNSWRTDYCQQVKSRGKRYGLLWFLRSCQTKEFSLQVQFGEPIKLWEILIEV